MIFGLDKYLFLFLFFEKEIVRTRFGFLAQMMDGLRPKKPKTINLQRVGWKNWVLVNQSTNKVGLNDKREKINKCKLKKIVLGNVQGDCSYILILNLITSLVPNCYSIFLFDFSIPLSPCIFSLLYSLFPSSLPSTRVPDGWC